MNYNDVEWGVPDNIRAIYSTVATGDLSPKNPDGIGNWKTLAKEINVSTDLPWVQQVHGSCLVEVPQHYGVAADASFSTQILTPSAVLTADCVPILLTNSKGRWVAAIHAGWKGLVNNIVAKGLKKLNSLNAKGEETFAYIGACICQTNYQVNESVKNELLSFSNKNSKLIVPCSQEDNKYLIDLSGIAKEQLRMQQVKQIKQYQGCSFAEERFFSYRKDAKTGRMAHIIWKAN